jgi:hypothetical protein
MPIQIFDNIDDALNFLKKEIEELDLSYIPKEKKDDILSDALSDLELTLLLDIVANKKQVGSGDLKIKLYELVGMSLLQYMEYQAKQNKP